MVVMQKYYFQTTSRYYTIQTQRDLFGDLVIVCCWGSRFTKQGGMKTIPARKEDGVDKIIKEIASRRKALVYLLIKTNCYDNIITT